MVRTLTDRDDVLDLSLLGGPDTVLAFQGNDAISSALNQPSSLLFGNEDNDTLTSQATGDTLYGGKDDDSLVSQAGRSLFYGDFGDDQFIAARSDGGDTVFGNVGADTIVFSAQARGNNLAYGGKNDDSLLSSISGRDSLYGDLGNDTVEVQGGLSNAGQNVLYGGDGDDSLLNAASRDTLYGDGPSGSSFTGKDYLVATASAERIYMYGGSDNDTLIAGSSDVGRDTLMGGDGNDSMSGVGIQSLMLGNQGEDTLIAVKGRTTLYGGQGDDSLFTAGSGTNLLYGDLGNDSLIGGTNDTLYGGDLGSTDTGTDYLTAGASSLMFGNKGNDTLNAAGTNASLYGGQGDDSLYGGANANLYMSGDLGNDTLALQISGAAGGSTLLGGDGNDSLFALSVTGGVYLDGGSGNDILVAGSTQDSLIGGVGNDLFVGTASSDTLGNEQGRTGNDTLYGFQGGDSLVGIVGQFDGFYYNGTDQGDDTITSFDTGRDELYFAASVFNLSPTQTISGLNFFVVASGLDYTGAQNNGSFVSNPAGYTGGAIVFDPNNTGSGGILYWDPNASAAGTADLSIIAIIQDGSVAAGDIVIF